MNALTTVEDGFASPSECWCCGSTEDSSRLIHLGNHPEVTLCVGCAHWAYLQGQQIEDRSRTGLVVRVKDELRVARRKVVERGWHRKPVVGRILRWLGRHTP